MCTELYRGRGRRRGSPLPQSSDSALSAPVGSPCPHFREQSTRAFPSWAGLECGSPCLTLSAVGQLSAQIASEVWGIQISGVSFGFIDPGHGPENKTVSPRGCAGRSAGNNSVPKTRWLAPPLPLPWAPCPGLQELAQGLFLSLVFIRAVPVSSFNPHGI